MVFLVGMVFSNPVHAAKDKPNILVIWGDDIGISNISAYSDGLMGYETPNIDRIAKSQRRSRSSATIVPAELQPGDDLGRDARRHQGCAEEGQGRRTSRRAVTDAGIGRPFWMLGPTPLQHRNKDSLEMMDGAPRDPIQFPAGRVESWQLV
jgi:hypothetical protein